MMESIIRESEKHLNEWGHLDSLVSSDRLDAVISIARAAKDLTMNAKVAAIVVFTISGASAMWISKTKPSVPIFAFTPEMRTYQWLGISWASPLLVRGYLETMIHVVRHHILNAFARETRSSSSAVSSWGLWQTNLALLYT